MQLVNKFCAFVFVLLLVACSREPSKQELKGALKTNVEQNLGVSTTQDIQTRQIPKFTLSAKTSFLKGPMRKDGFVDYAAAINEQLSRGVPSSGNACIDLFLALGPAPETSVMPNEFFSELGMERPKKGDGYLKSFFNFVDERERTEEQIEKICDELNNAMSHPWNPEEYPELSTWVEQNKRPLEFIRSASQFQRFYAPLVVKTYEANGHEPLVFSVATSRVFYSRSAGQLLCVRAMLNLARNNFDKAWLDLLACRRLGRLVAMGSTVSDSLTGFEIENMSHEAMIMFIRESKPTAKQIAIYREQLNGVPPYVPIGDKINLTERCIVLDALNAMVTKHKKSVEILSWYDGFGSLSNTIELFELDIDLDSAYRACNQWFDRSKDITEIPEYAKRKELIGRFQSELYETSISSIAEQLDQADSPAKQRGIISKKVGAVAAAIHLYDLMPLSFALDKTKQIANNVDVALGLAAFHADKGCFPKQLSELGPEYISAKPLDLFSGKELIYQRLDSGYLLYSIGSDMVDDCGRAHDDEPQGDDLSIGMNLR